MVKCKLMERTSGTAPAIVMRGRSIAHRITLLAGSAVLLAVIVVTALLVSTGVNHEFATRKRSLEATGYVFASAVADHLAAGNPEQSLLVLRSISRIPEVTYAAVLDSSGRSVAALGSTVLLDPDHLSRNHGILDVLRNGSYPVAVDVIKSGAPIGKVLLITDMTGVRQQLIGMVLSSLAVAIVSIALSFVVAWRLQRRITAPITALTQVMQEVSATRSYDRKVNHDAEGETRLLIDSFNQMLSEIRARDIELARHRQSLEATVEQRTIELRRARDAAQAANEAKSSFLATMSHEIRTPLNGLMVMAELLAGAGLDQRLQRYAEVIVKSGQSLLTIIGDILDFSKIEAGKLDLELMPTDPAAIADDVTSLYWEKAASKGLDLAARVAPDVPRSILADPVRLNQILSNLVNNALKFTETGQILISLSHRSGNLTIAVSDSGIGIPQKKMDILFDAFSQADQSITRRFGGTGLGLAICKRLAEAMGGTIGVNSELGRGSTFWVKIPTMIADPAPRFVRGSTLHAGLAIDGLASQSALGTCLAAAGFAVEQASHDWKRFDVVFATPRHIREQSLSPGCRPIIICIGWIGEPEGEAAIAEGLADDLMILPLRQQDIEDMIRRIRTNTLRGPAVLQRRVKSPTSLEARFSGHRVLVADDNAVNREVLIEVLRQLGATVRIAVNGLEAVDVWKRERPDLIFMDCSMPELDGFAATREIRAHEALDIVSSHTPIIALTAHVSGTDGNTWRQAGMDAYLTKPFTLHQISDCLSTHLKAAGEPFREQQHISTATAGQVLDDAVIREIRRIGGNDMLFRRVLDLFAREVPRALERLSHLAAEDGDRREFADAAHALKSMCANIGATRAMEACDRLEQMARQGAILDSSALEEDVEREVSAALAEVAKLRAA